jgi:hypothetical protein
VRLNTDKGCKLVYNYFNSTHKSLSCAAVATASGIELQSRGIYIGHALTVP